MSNLISLEDILKQVVCEIAVRASASNRVKLAEDKILLEVYNNIAGDYQANLYCPYYNFTENPSVKLDMFSFHKPSPYIVVKYIDILGKSGVEFKKFADFDSFKGYLQTKESYLDDYQIPLINGYILTKERSDELNLTNEINPLIISKHPHPQSLIDYFDSIHILYQEPTHLKYPYFTDRPFKRSIKDKGYSRYLYIINNCSQQHKAQPLNSTKSSVASN